MEGLQLLKVYLEFFSFVDVENDAEFDKNIKSDDKTIKSKDNYRWCEFHGGISKETRKINKDIFNRPDNKYGKYIKIIMISPAGAEGISLNNVRQVHIMEPYWNEVRMDQVIGRALRYCHHKDLPLEERIVDVYRYKMVRKNNIITTDEKLESISRRKNNLLLSFIEAVKEAAVDCELFKAHNMMGNKYKCFQFNEDSLFEKPVGPAYQHKLEYDMKSDNGSNSKDSNRIKIKVYKIKAVKEIDNTYSKDENYWFNDDTGIVYDINLDYPIGRVSKDDSGHFKKLDSNTYIISDIIDIPNFTLYT
jgi:hypothetical protein